MLWWIVGGAAVFLVVFFMVAGRRAQTPLSADDLEDRLARVAQKTLERTKHARQVSLSVHSRRLGIDVSVHVGEDGPDAFHVASVGKLFAMASIGMLIDQERLTLEMKAASLLPAGTLDGLFVVAGSDHQHAVSVGQLLNHTSGVADYFSDAEGDSEPVSRRMVTERDRTWTPSDLLEFTRRELCAVGTPGSQFHYSDTGYVLLGLIVESVTGTSYESYVHEQIFDRLEMERSFFPGRTLPREGTTSIRPAYIHGVDVSSSPSLTGDWAGGGVASTGADLLRFSEALFGGRLVSQATLERFQSFDHVYRNGIHYGYGLMQYRFGEFLFLLKSYPKMIGHMGVLGTQLFCDPERDLHIVCSLGTEAGTANSVRLVINSLGLAMRVKDADYAHLSG